MFSSKMQNVKEAAYFDYFKSFSLNAFDTIKKLQNQFKDQISDNFFFEPNNMFKRVKTLLGSYEILVLEINDSCEFVQIPEFGNCILKIFLQTMSIIKFLLKSIIVRAAQKQHQRESFSMSKKDKEKQENSKVQTPEINQQKLFYKKKEQSRFMFQNINNQLSLLEDEQALNVENCNKNLRVVIQGKEKLQSIQVSQNQSILSQTLNNFYKKGEHLNNFVNIRQAAMMANMKEGISDSYCKVKQILDEDSNKKLINASQKLQQIFKAKIEQHFLQKQSQMVNYQCQVNIQDSNQAKLLQQSKHIRKLSEINKKIQGQIKYERDKVQSLQKLLKEKTEQFQLTTMQYRLSKIQMDNKLSFIKKNTKTQSECGDENQTMKNRSVCDSVVLEQLNEDEFDDLNNLMINQENNGSSQQNQDSGRKKSTMFQKKVRRIQCRQKNRLQFQRLPDNKSQFLAISNLVSVVKLQPYQRQIQQVQGQGTTGIFSKKKFGNSRALSSVTQAYQRNNVRQNTKLMMKLNSLEFISNIFQIKIGQPNDLSQNAISSSSKTKKDRQLFMKKNNSGNQGNRQQSLERVNTQIYNQQESRSFIQNFQINTLETYHELSHNHHGSTSSNSESRKGQGIDNKVLNRQNPIISIQKQSEINSASSNSHTINTNYFKKTIPNLKGQESKLEQKGKYLSKKKCNENSIFQANQSLQHSYIKAMNNSNNINTNLKYPRFLKMEKPVHMNSEDIKNIFFDQLTAQNFQYVNLYQAEQKLNKKNIIQVAQMQKKNLMNLLSRAGNQTCKNGNNLTVFSTLKQNSPSSLSLNNTLGKSSNLWNTLKFGINLSKQMNAYDAEKLAGMMYKQLKDLKKSCKDGPSNSYTALRNFLRYPFSTIKLQKDEKFTQKQKEQPEIQYLELRKIMQRIFKLHASCWKKNLGALCQDNKFQKLNFPQQQNQLADGQVKLCEHLIVFYQKCGIVLPAIQ